MSTFGIRTFKKLALFSSLSFPVLYWVYNDTIYKKFVPWHKKISYKHKIKRARLNFEKEGMKSLAGQYLTGGELEDIIGDQNIVICSDMQDVHTSPNGPKPFIFNPCLDEKDAFSFKVENTK